MTKVKKVFYSLCILIITYIILGFTIFPYIAKNQLIKNLDENLNLKSSIEKIQFNPLTLETKINNFDLKDEKNCSVISLNTLLIKPSFWNSISQKHIDFSQILLDGAILNIIQEKDSSFNFEKFLKKTKKEDSTKKEENSFDIKFLISKIDLQNANIKFVSNNLKEPYILELKEINYSASNIGTYKDALSSNDLKFKLNNYTDVLINGAFKISPFDMNGKVSIKNLKIKELLDYKKDLFNFDLNKEANLNLALNYSLDLSKDFDLKLNTDLLEINKINLTQNKQSLSSLKKFSIKRVDFDLIKQNINFSDINIEDLGANIVLDDKGINFRNLINSSKNESLKETKSKPWNVNISTLKAKTNFSFEDKVDNINLKSKNLDLKISNLSTQNELFRIEKTEINNGMLDFEDKNLPISFKTTISKLNANILEIKNDNLTKTNLEINGLVDKYGVAKITGIINPNDIKFLTNINLKFQNIAMQNFTPYSGKFLGRELKSGKLDLDLKYNIDKSNIEAKNSIVISKLELGKKIQSKDAVSLPLDIAISLLKDSNGVINIDIPVWGNVDNPEFSVSSIIWKAFTNLLTKTATAPFTALASMFNFNEDEINMVKFDINEEKITPIQKETLDKIAQILTAKKNLAIKISPSFNKEKEQEKISKNRVLNIKDYLLKEKTIDKKQVIIDEKIENSNSWVEIKIVESR